MRKTPPLFFILLFSCQVLRAQPPSIVWQKCLGGNYGDWPRSIEPTQDGGTIIGGVGGGPGGDVTGYHGINDIKDYWIVKTDASGNIQWSRSLGGDDADLGSVVRQTPDGGYIVGGFADSQAGDGDVTGPSHGGPDGWVVKLDGAGNIQWQKTIGGEEADVLSALEPTPDGGYILAGSTSSTGGDISGQHGFLDAWVVKIDGTGIIQWQKCLGGRGEDEATSIQVLPDGNYIVTGYTYSNDGDFRGNHGRSDIWATKLDGSGGILWSKVMGGTLDDEAYDLVATPDGGMILAGYCYSSDGDAAGKDPLEYPYGGADVWVIRLDKNGNLLWQHSFGGSADDGAYCISATPDGNYVLAGYYTSVNMNQTCPKGEEDIWLLKISPNGDLIWQKGLGGIGRDVGYSIKPTRDGGYIMAASTTSPELPGYHADGSLVQGDFYIVKLSADPPPAITINAPPDPLCAGVPFSFAMIAPIVNDGSRAYWYRNGKLVSSNSYSYTASDWVDGDQVYLTANILEMFCDGAPARSNTVTLHVSPLPAPSIKIRADAGALCQGAIASFTATVTNGHARPLYQWDVNGSPAGTGSPLFSSTSLGKGDIVTCIYSDDAACSVPPPNISNAVTVLQLPAVIPSVSIGASATTICVGSEVDFTAKAVNGGGAPSYQWSVNGLSAGTDNPNFSGSAFSDGDQVSCVLTSDAACPLPATVPSQTITLTVKAFTPSSLSIGYDPVTLCSGKLAVFTATAAGGGITPSYQWTVNAKPVGTDNPSYTSSTLSTGDIVSCLLSDPADCILATTTSVTPLIYPTPRLAQVPPIDLPKGQSVILDLSPTGDITTYLWSPTTGLSDPAIAAPVATPSVTTIYTLQVGSPPGCTDSGSVLVRILSKPAIPGAFSPNGDGKNDIFYVMGGLAGSRIKDFVVLDRWGGVVFQVHDVMPDDPRFGWNGRVGDRAAEPGTYVYTVRMGLADGTSQIYKGTVLLVR